MSRTRDGFAQGFGAGVGWQVAALGGRLLKRWGYRFVLAVVFLLAGAASYLQTHRAARWSLGVALLVALVLWARSAGNGPSVLDRVRRRRAPGALRHTLGKCWWVYVIREYRDARGAIVPLSLVDVVPCVRHLVYIGKTSSFDLRMLQHRGPGPDTKPWWHDELLFELPGQWWSDAEALAVERRMIEAAARQARVEDRPRENVQHNDSHDPAYAARMRQLAAVA